MFKLGWIIWAVLAFLTFGIGWLPNEIKVYDTAGYTGVSVPGPLQIILLAFVVGWPIYGWVTYEKY